MNGLMMNDPLTITSILNYAEQVFPDREIVSVVHGGAIHRYRYKDASIRIRQLANALKSAGVTNGDRIGTLAWNDYRHLELYYAVPAIGAVCHTINPRLFEDQINYIINHANDKLLFVDPAFVGLMESLQKTLPKGMKFIVLSDDENMPSCQLADVISYESFIGEHSDKINWPDLTEDSASSLCYTSGTTGNPKGVLYSHRSTILHAYAIALPNTMSLSLNDVVMPIVPMFHVNAWSIPYASMMAGAKLVLPGHKMGDGASLSSLINGEGVTISAGVPTVWLALLAYLDKAKEGVGCLERIVVGGSSCPLSIIQEFSNKYDVDVQQAWGMTETSPLGTYNSLSAEMKTRPLSEIDALKVKQGRPVFGVDLKVVDSEDQELPWGQESIGEVKVRGPWVCSGYFGVDDSSAHDSKGWFATGDVACMDSDGFMRITDRTKDVIKSGGEWISSIDLENAAVCHSAIAEAAVIGIAHPKWAERPLLILVKVEGEEVSKEDLLASMAKYVSSWWLPDDVAYVDSLPHTATGKLDKKALRLSFDEYQFPIG